MKNAVISMISILMIFCSACNENKTRVAEGSFEYTEENLPKICVAENTYNYGVNIVAAVLGVDAQQAAQHLLVAENTDDCYMNLINGNCDMVIAYEYGKKVGQELSKTSSELNSFDIKQDALVFFTNSNNEVSDLSTEQLLKIYKREIIDWSEISGKLMPITLFGQDESTAVKATFEKYFTEEIIVPPVLQTIEIVDGKYTAQVYFDNRNGSIGYDLLSNYDFTESVKLLSVNSVLPGAETLENGQYPFKTSVKISIKQSENTRTPVFLLYDWLCSGQGKQLF